METPPKEKKLIVLVEDEQIIADLLEAKLVKSGYLVKTAHDGAKGLDLIRNFQPDLVLLDMLLPKLDGFGVLENLYAEKILPSLPIIIISNSGQPFETERALALGVRDYLVKINFDPNDVLEKVGRVLSSEAERPNAPPAGNIGRAGDASRGQILIVEDDLLLVDLLSRKFCQRDYSVSIANDVRQARAILEKKPIALILLDIVLPGMDGFAFLAEIKATDKWKGIPVVIISNLGQTEEVERGLKAGATDYIIKAHTNPGEIVMKVDSLLAPRVAKNKRRRK